MRNIFLHNGVAFAGEGNRCVHFNQTLEASFAIIDSLLNVLGFGGSFVDRELIELSPNQKGSWLSALFSSVPLE